MPLLLPRNANPKRHPVPDYTHITNIYLDTTFNSKNIFFFSVIQFIDTECVVKILTVKKKSSV